MLLAQQMSGAAGTMGPGALHAGAKGGMVISEPMPGAKPLPVPPELAALMASGGMGPQVGSSSTLTSPFCMPEYFVAFFLAAVSVKMFVFLQEIAILVNYAVFHQLM